MKSVMFIDYLHEEGSDGFNPELSPVSDNDVNEIFSSPSNGVQDEVNSHPAKFATHGQMEVSETSYVLRGRGEISHLPLLSFVDSRNFVSWLYEVECYFEGTLFSDAMKCEMIVSCLKGIVLLWYNGLKLSRIEKGKGRIKTWSKLKYYMKQHFIANSTLIDLWSELKNLRQNSLSVNKYARVFEELHFICDMNVEIVQKGVRFFHGLKSEITQHIDLEMKYSYDELYELALCIEKSLVMARKFETLVESGCLEAVKIDGNERGLNQNAVVLSCNATGTKCHEPSVGECFEPICSYDENKSPCFENETVFDCTLERTDEHSRIRTDVLTPQVGTWLNSQETFLIGKNVQQCYYAEMDSHENMCEPISERDVVVGVLNECGQPPDLTWQQELGSSMGNTVTSTSIFDEEQLPFLLKQHVLISGLGGLKDGCSHEQTEICASHYAQGLVYNVRQRHFIQIFDPSGKNGNASVKMGFNCFQ